MNIANSHAALGDLREGGLRVLQEEEDETPSPVADESEPETDSPVETPSPVTSASDPETPSPEAGKSCCFSPIFVVVRVVANKEVYITEGILLALILNIKYY